MVSALREVLDRFRSAGPPGPADLAAVPADRRGVLLEVSAVLSPLVRRETAALHVDLRTVNGT